MDSYTSIAVSQRGSLRSVLLNRPSALNAFDPALWIELEHALRQAGEDEAVRCVVVRGSGTNFSAGYDLPSALEELEHATPAMIRTHIERGNRACWAAWRHSIRPGWRRAFFATIRAMLTLKYCIDTLCIRQ